MRTYTTTYQGYKQPKGQKFPSTALAMKSSMDLITI